MALYTPFVERNIDKMAAAMQQSQQTKLAQSAYMGDSNAMGQLYGTNPELAERIKQRRAQEKQRQLSQQGKEQATQQKTDEYNREQMETVKERMAKMPYEQAKEFGERAAAELGIEPPPLTQEIYDQIVSGYGEAEEEVIREIPEELLSGLDEQIATKGAAAYRAAGGGKDGLKAFNEIVDKGGESQRRAASPQILSSNFPTASPAELDQLQATMDAAKTTESGLKNAEKVRKEQRRLKKAKTFQGRALDLINRILNSDQLGDVLGSLEGRIDIKLFSDAESQVIADIEEAGNILTADNMDLMTGVLSESDIQILKNLSGGALIRTRTEERFVEDLTALRDKLSSQNVTTVDDEAATKQSSEIAVKRSRLAELRAKAGQ